MRWGAVVRNKTHGYHGEGVGGAAEAGALAILHTLEGCNDGHVVPRGQWRSAGSVLRGQWESFLADGTGPAGVNSFVPQGQRR